MIDKYRNKKIVIATHVYTTGPAQDLKKFLNSKKIKKLLFIGHPLFYSLKLKGSGFELYQEGKLSASFYHKIRNLRFSIACIKDILLNFYWVLKTKEKWDLYVGCNCLNAFCGIIFKSLGKVDKTVFYVIDYNPHHFSNRILNYIYHQIDQFCVRFSDETWNLSYKMEVTRKKYFNFHAGNQRFTPIGVWLNRIKRASNQKKSSNTLIYMGGLTKKQGVQNAIKAIPTIIKKIPEFRFLIIGDGEYAPALKQMVKNLKIEKFVEFTGYVKDHETVEKLMLQGSVAVSLYEKYSDGHLSFTYFTDPGKIKVYLACGLPILTTDVPYNAKEIEAKKCGFVVGYSKQRITDAVIKLMSDKNLLRKYQKNSVDYVRQFDWNIIFENNLQKLLDIV
jgi:glycosyltransferase involved in cell wall biosynthesis